MNEEAKRIPDGGGVRISRQEAIRLLLNDLVPKGMEVMCYQYGSDSCDECEGECVHWAGISKDDLDEDVDSSFDMREHFELWAN